MHALLNHMGGNHFNLGGIPSGLMEEKCLKGNKEKKKGDNVSKLEFIKMQVNFQARSNDLILHFMGNVKLCNFRVGWKSWEIFIINKSQTLTGFEKNKTEDRKFWWGMGHLY